MKYIYNNLSLRVALLMACIGFLFVPRLSAQFTITEDFKSSSVGSDIVVGGNAILTSGTVDPVGQGWLRLTEDQGNQSGYAYIDQSFPSGLGVLIDFEYKTWRTTGTGADGICLFLFDASVPFSIGGIGGALGYSPKGSNTGLTGAYMGIGFDEWGNFTRNSPDADEPWDGPGTTHLPNSVTLRGPAPGYNYRTHKRLNTSTEGTIAYETIVSARPGDDIFYRRVKISIVPIGTDDNPRYRITVKWMRTPNGNEEPLIEYETTDPLPANLKLGFGASTGGNVNYHEIRNLLITTPGGVRVQKSVDKDNAVPGEELTYMLNVYNETNAAITNLALADTVKLANGNFATGDDFEMTSITFHNNGNTGNTAAGFESGTSKTIGLTNPFSTTLNMEANSMASFTVTGTVKRVPQGGVLRNSVAIDPSGTGITDTDLTNNYSSVTTTILNPDVDLKIEKVVDNNGIARQSGNTFTIVVSNMSSQPKPGGQEVKVTDVIPPGLTVTGVTAEGWNQSVSGSTYTFTRSDRLEAQYAYPPITINVTPSGTGPWENTAEVDYQNDQDDSNDRSSASLKWPNYWYGGKTGEENTWSDPENWTGNYVPLEYEDIEFATAENNGGSNGRGTGPAQEDLHLDTDRKIGDLINKSDKDLLVTTGNELRVGGRVWSDNTGGIIVKADPADLSPGGTLIFENPADNPDVTATVEFYNKAFDCEECGFYRRSWQYFGIPVNSSTFPYSHVTGDETINRWNEPTNDNKWVSVPSGSVLEAFKGYEITSSSTTQPAGVYSFEGTLNVGDAGVDLTKTANVNYSGANLVANSYMAAIPINKDALVFPEDIDQTVYLFNTGTRDQWRKLNGTAINQGGYRSGQYLAVPLNLGEQTNINLPDRIPAMHSFMVLFPETHAPTGGIPPQLEIKYGELVKNTTVNRGDGEQIVTRSAKSDGAATPASSTIPFLVMDVIGEQSADRVWVFAKEGTSHGFDNGWDGRKMSESGIAQLYVTDDNDRFQVATVPGLDNVVLGFDADTDGKYMLEFALSDHWTTEDIYLYDLSTGTKERVTNGGSYTFEAKKDTSAARFRLSSTGGDTLLFEDEAVISVTSTTDRTIVIRNDSDRSCSVFISDIRGKLLQRLEVQSGSEEITKEMTGGTYIVRLQNAVVNDVRRVTVE